MHDYDLDSLNTQGAVCHRAAGRGDRAVGLLEEQLHRVQEGMTRDRGHLTAKLAVAVAQSPQPDPARAAHLGHEALEAAAKDRLSPNPQRAQPS
ncbi:hypothetical protein Ssi02_66030 [Sinosporangium siamense]|uniref:Uncharacterized protein n=1 Tax=Sinosporangium siamense TaxID=1367973 RepID=A0A919RNE4_9ACTN|nr:hypothetical protein Ssi02_66030 [Sinosporangium siamense]